MLAKRVAADLTSMVVQGQAPQRSFSLTTFYLIVIPVSLLILGLQVRNLMRLKRRALTWASMYRFHPDLTLVMGLAAGLALITGIGRLVNRPPGHGQA